jgi:hypothetical protein
MSITMTDGARIVVRDWLRIKEGERLTIISDELHVPEAMEMRAHAAVAGAMPTLVIVSSSSPQSGEGFDAGCVAFLGADAIIGATHNSIMTTRAISDAVHAGSRFLSIPLATNDGTSLLEGDMMTMDPEEALGLAQKIKPVFQGARAVRVRTALGTDLRVSIEGRTGSIFRGLCDRKGMATSVSFEYSISIVESETQGSIVLDGSMGYIGLVDEPVALSFEGGRLVDIENNPSGRRLADYVRGFDDQRMYVAGELGIGLNTKARCEGRSYIEDECTYGTFHIGMGRNITLGGQHYANGHFDLITREPDITVDDALIMAKGEII